jgi:hypothetical protein
METTSNPPPPTSECPDEAPSEGSSCQGFVSGLTCDTPEDDCVDIRCSEDGAWELVANSCNPPPPSTECPGDLPAAGSSCAGFQPGLVCGGSDDSCDGVRCSETSKWQLVASFCNPPPPSTECPDEIPSAKTSCAGYQEGLICPETTCPPTDHVSCGKNGTWEPLAISCNPPPPTH